MPILRAAKLQGFAVIDKLLRWYLIFTASFSL